jgi:hypothetical protein
MDAEFVHIAVTGLVGIISFLAMRSVHALDRSQDETKESVTRAHDRISENAERLTVCETLLGVKGGGHGFRE